MNLIITFFVAGLLYLIPAFTSAQTTDASSMNYKDCTALVYSNSANALAYADSWIAGGKAPVIAKHCRALALYGMKHFPAAAKELDDFAAIPSSSIPTKIGALKQAAQAWQDAGIYQSAINSLGQAIAISSDSEINPQNYDMLMQQAGLLIKTTQYLEAIHALDNALEINPAGTEAMVLRSRIYQTLGVNTENISSLSPRAGKFKTTLASSSKKSKPTTKISKAKAPDKVSHSKKPVKSKSITKTKR